eukprot:6323827-Pyramimonas_sp.AAC.1
MQFFLASMSSSCEQRTGIRRNGHRLGAQSGWSRPIQRQCRADVFLDNMDFLVVGAANKCSRDGTRRTSRADAWQTYAGPL